MPMSYSTEELQQRADLLAYIEKIATAKQRHSQAWSGRLGSPYVLWA